MKRIINTTANTISENSILKRGIVQFLLSEVEELRNLITRMEMESMLIEDVSSTNQVKNIQWILIVDV